MKYAVYFTYKDDGFNDTFNIENSKYRYKEIRHMIKRKMFSEISYSKIYKNGEYGKRKIVYKEKGGV